MTTKVTNAAIAASVLLLPLSLATVAGAQAPNPYLPPLAAPKPLHLPEIIQQTLPNGMKLVLLEDHKQPALWMSLALPAGGVRDPKEKVGMASMAASLLDKGTTTRSEAQIADTVDGIGATLGASADDDYLTVSATGLSSFTDTLFDLMADITLNPTFPDIEIDRYRTQTLSAITASLGQPGTLADLALARVIFGDHPYGNFSLGTPKTLPAIMQADLKAFHETYFAPNVATLFIVGDITPAQAEEKAVKAFGGWQKKDVPGPPPAPRPGDAASDSKPRIYLIDRPGAAQTEIRIGSLTTGYNDPQRIPGNVASTVLGGGAFGNRLTQEIRVKRGLTYGVASFFARNKEAGKFAIETFTKNATTGEVIRLALGEVDKLRDAPPPDAELAERKTYLTGTFAVSVATPEGVLRRLIPAVLYGNGPEDLTTYTEKVLAVTPQAVQDIFKGISSGAIGIILVGDAKEVQPQVASLGTVTVIAPDALDLLSPTLKGSAAKPVAVSAEDTAKGKALLDATVKAHGGDAFLALKSLTFTGKGELTTPQTQGGTKIPIDSLTLVSALPDRTRLDMNTGFGPITTASPGGGKPAWLSVGGQVMDPPGGGGSGGSLDPATLVIRAAKNGYAVAALPDSDAPTADGKKLKGFAITDDRGKTSNVFVETDTGLVRRVENKTPNGSATVVLGSYKKAEGGVMVPTTLELLVNGQEQLSLTFTGVDLNKPVSDSVFDRPN
jgi:zinc protease